MQSVKIRGVLDGVFPGLRHLSRPSSSGLKRVAARHHVHHPSRYHGAEAHGQSGSNQLYYLPHNLHGIPWRFSRRRARTHIRSTICTYNHKPRASVLRSRTYYVLLTTEYGVHVPKVAGIVLFDFLDRSVIRACLVASLEFGPLTCHAVKFTR